MLTQKNSFTEIDSQVKSLHKMLNELAPEERIEYIKSMLPKLLSFSATKATSAQDRLCDQLKNPVQDLTDEQKELIINLATKTEDLYNTMNRTAFFE